MTGQGESAARTCAGCGAALVTNARFCAHCGLPAGSAGGDPVPLLDHVSTPAVEATSSIGGRARRQGVPEWLAVVGGVAAVLTVWFVISRPSSEVESATAEQQARVERSVEMLDGDPLMPSFPSATVDSTTAPSESPTVAAESTSEPAPPTSRAAGDEVGLDALDGRGWRLLVGDGHAIVDVDLESGVQTRHEGVGAPIALVDGRLLVYRDSRLGWTAPADLGRPPDEIVEVAALQRMFTRGRSADRPVVVDGGAAIWWPNNNANPQTWVKLDLDDGVVLDSISLTESVFGGPEVVATIGSGTFERIDGRWTKIGNLFASSASPDAVVGQQCDRPEACSWVLQGREGTGFPPERLDVGVGGPFDLGLVADADRTLLLESDGVTDYGTGRFVPMVGANATTLTATNRIHLLAMADGAGIERRSSLVTVVDLDGTPDRSVTSVTVDDLIPRWLVLVPPDTGGR